MKLFDEVKERASVREVMERAGIVFNRNNMCKCPFHQDKRASMKVKPTDKKFFCFGCGEKGDAIDFVAKYYNLTKKEAAMRIAEDYGIEEDRKDVTLSQTTIVSDPMEMLEKHRIRYFRILSDYYHMLRAWKRELTPRSMEKIDARYEEAVKSIPYLEHQLDELLFGTTEDILNVLIDCEKEVVEIERRVKEYRRNKFLIDKNRERI